MSRTLGTFFGLLALTVVLLAQEPEVLKKKKKPAEPVVEEKDAKQTEKAKDDKALEELKKLVEEGGKLQTELRKEAGRDMKELMARLHKSMDKAEDLLIKKDPGAETVKTQEEIIRDLDELLKQNDKSNSGGGGGGGSQSSSSAGDSSSSSSKNQQQSRSERRQQQKSAGSPKNKPEGSLEKKDPMSSKKEDKKQGGGQDQKEKKDDSSAKSEKGGDGSDSKKDPKNDGGSGGGNKDRDQKNTVSELFKNPWGHLPLNQRQQMDIYGKQRFLDKYEELLKQYYRTIAEQGRVRPGE